MFFHRKLAVASGGTAAVEPRLAWTISPEGPWRYNAVLRCNLSESEVGATIARFGSGLSRQGVGGSWKVSPLMRPESLAQRLSDSGYTLDSVDPGMTLKLDALVESGTGASPCSEELAIRRVVDGPDLDDFLDVTARGFESARSQWLGNAIRQQDVRDRSLRFYVGYCDGEAVSAATGCIHMGVAGLYFLSTSESSRMKGFGTSMTYRILGDARDAGCGIAVLSSSQLGYSLYRRLGFGTCVDFEIWKSPDPSDN